MCRSALHLAARAGALDVLEVLLEDLEKADRREYVNAADKSGITPVFLAKQRGRNTSLFNLSVWLLASLMELMLISCHAVVSQDWSEQHRSTLLGQAKA